MALTRPSKPTKDFPKGIMLETVPAESEIVRIHHRDHGSVWFGPRSGSPPAYRFDAPSGEYRVMYAAADLDGAFVETILHGRTKDRIVARAYVNQRKWTILQTRRDLVLVKLYDEGLLWHGTDAGISAWADYTEPRRMALALFTEDRAIDGLVYRSRHDNGKLCFALFDRVAATDLAPVASHFFSECRSEFESLAEKYGSFIDDDPPLPPL